MPSVVRKANAHTTVTTGWTDPANAYGDAGDGVYARATPAASVTIDGDFGFPNVTTDPTAGPWTSRTIPFSTASDDIMCVSYGNGVWVAGGTSGKLATASDPTSTWTLNGNAHGANSHREVVYGGGVWVTVGASGDIYTATDPTGAWTQRTSPTANELLGLAYDGSSTWVAVGRNSTLIYATDPTGTWTANTNMSTYMGGASITINAVAFGNGRWVLAPELATAGGLYGTATPSGTWTLRTTPIGTSTGVAHDVRYGGTTWVAVGQQVVPGTCYVITATDPTSTWTSRTHGFGTDAPTALAYSGSMWIAVGDNAKICSAVTPTGTWTAETSTFSATADHHSVGFGNGVFVAGGQLAAVPALAESAPESPGLPDGATIDAVRIVCEVGLEGSGPTFGMQGRRSGVNSGSEATKTTTTEEQITHTFAGGAISLADLRSASTVIKGRARITG